MTGEARRERDRLRGAAVAPPGPWTRGRTPGRRAGLVQQVPESAAREGGGRHSLARLTHGTCRTSRAFPDGRDSAILHNRAGRPPPQAIALAPALPLSR